MNEVIKAMLERRSIRSFSKEMPSDADIDQIVQAGLYAASGRDSQLSVIIVIKDKETRDRFSEVNGEIWGKGMDPFYGAPLIIAVVSKKTRPTYVYDGSLVLGNMMLAAHTLGLGSCWIHRAKEEFELEEFRKILADLGLEGEYEGIGHLAVGYIEGDVPEARRRKDNRVFYI